MRRLPALLPGALLLAAATVVLVVPAVREAMRPLAPVAARLVIAAGILVGLRFRNLRTTVALAVLAMAGEVLLRAPTAETAAPRELEAAVALLLPLNLAAVAWTSDRGGGRARARAWTLALALQALAVAVLVLPPTAAVARAWWGGLLDAVALPWPARSQPGLLAFAVALVLAVLRFALRPRPTESGLVWAIVATFVAVGLTDRLSRTLYFGTAALVLGVALVETSYAMAYGDELTGLPARRALNELLGELRGRYAVAMVDIDHFKTFNDTYGHQVGDQLLRKVAATLLTVGGGGRAFRYGGEEFAIVFPGFDAEHATPHLEDLREAIAASRFTVRGPDRPRKKPQDVPRRGPLRQAGVTVSIGVADSAHVGPTAADVVKAADRALYRAKRGGRNRLAT